MSLNLQKWGLGSRKGVFKHMSLSCWLRLGASLGPGSPEKALGTITHHDLHLYIDYILIILNERTAGYDLHSQGSAWSFRSPAWCARRSTCSHGLSMSAKANEGESGPRGKEPMHSKHWKHAIERSQCVTFSDMKWPMGMVAGCLI